MGTDSGNESRVEYRVYIMVERREVEVKDPDLVRRSNTELELCEHVEAPFALKALGIVLRRAMQIPLALKAAAEGDDPYRGTSG